MNPGILFFAFYSISLLAFGASLESGGPWSVIKTLGLIEAVVFGGLLVLYILFPENPEDKNAKRS